MLPSVLLLSLKFLYPQGRLRYEASSRYSVICYELSCDQIPDQQGRPDEGREHTRRTALLARPGRDVFQQSVGSPQSYRAKQSTRKLRYLYSRALIPSLAHSSLSVVKSCYQLHYTLELESPPRLSRHLSANLWSCGRESNLYLTFKTYDSLTILNITLQRHT